MQGDSLGQGSRVWEREEEGTEGPHGDLLPRIQRIRARQSYRTAMDWLFQRLYADLRYVGYESAAAPWEVLDLLDGRLTENVTKTIVDTAHAKLDKIRVMPVADSVGGDWDLQYTVANLNHYMSGRFAELEVFPRASRGKLHGLIYGTGLAKVWYDRIAKRPAVDIVPAPECWVDPSEARYDEPRTFWQTKAIDRGVLAEMFPDYEEQIDKAQGVSGLQAEQVWTSIDTASDMIVVAEVWHLPPRGRRVLFLDNVTLANEEWKRDTFPFARFRWGMRPYGYWGIGLCEELLGLQLEHNRVTQARQEAVRYLSAPYVLMERGAKIIKSHMSDLIGRIIEYTGTAPQVVAPEPIAQGFLDHGDRCKRAMFEDTGISGLSAMMQKPPGLNSGRAIRNYVDLESERFIRALHESEEFMLRIARLLLDEEHEHGKGTVLYESPEGVERVEWPDIARDQYRLRIEPVSALSQTFAGKIEDVYDLQGLGLAKDPGEVRDLLGIPDLRRNRDLSQAHRDLLQQILEQRLMRDGDYVEPEPFWNLALGRDLAVNLLARAQLKGAPADRLELLRTWIQACTERLEAAKQAAAGPPPGPQNGAAAPALEAPAPLPQQPGLA